MYANVQALVLFMYVSMCTGVGQFAWTKNYKFFLPRVIYDEF